MGIITQQMNNNRIGSLSIIALEKGVICPYCTQYAKIYKRTINSATAKALIVFSKLEPVGQWHHLEKAFPDTRLYGGDFAKLAYWGLVEEMQKDPLDTHKKTSGYWRLLDKGARFIQGQEAVPKYSRVFNAVFLGHFGPLVTIHECLNNRFSYEKLMSL